MRQIVSFLFLIFYFQIVNGQDTAIGKKIIINSYEALVENQRIVSNDTLVYRDSATSYQVEIPKWLALNGKGDEQSWGGNLRALNYPSNTINIKVFPKKQYKSFKDFKKDVIGALVFGSPLPWNTYYVCMGKKDNGKYKKIGVAYTVYVMANNVIYHCKYILIETKTGYIWIEYFSDAESFTESLKYLDEFMQGMNIDK